MKKAVCYNRVSTTKQDFERQIFELSTFAKRAGYKIVRVFAEKVSGLKKAKDRTEFESMREYVEKEGVDLILATEISRFGRTQLDTQINVQYFVEKKVNIYFKDANLFTLNKEGKYDGITELHISILANRAQEEVRSLKQRIKSGLRYSVSNGGAGTGIVKPYGFQNVDKKLVIDPEESKVIKLIFDLYTKGMGCSQIAAHLNSKGIKTRYQKIFGEQEVKTRSGESRKGNKFSWSDGTIATILKNTIYKGERIFSKEKIEIDAIIDPIIFDQVQVLKKKRNNRPIRMIKNDNFIKGLIKCGKCGQPYYIHKREDNSDNSYKCLSKKLVYSGKVKKCTSPSINIDKLMNSLFIIANDLVYTNLSTKTSSQEISIGEKIKLKKIEIERLLGEAKKFEKKLDGLIDFLTDGTIDKIQFNKKKYEYQSQLDKVNNQIKADLSSFTQLQENKNKPSRNYYTKETFQANIREVIECIKIYEVPLKNFTDTFPAKQEVLLMVEVRSTFDLIDDTPLVKHFMVSRRSHTIAFPAFETNTNVEKQITKGQFEIDFHYSLKDFKPIALHNNFIKKRGSNSKPPIYKPNKGAMVVGTFEMINGKYRKIEKA